jgi:hypothetical protein
VKLYGVSGDCKETACLQLIGLSHFDFSNDDLRCARRRTATSLGLRFKTSFFKERMVVMLSFTCNAPKSGEWLLDSGGSERGGVNGYSISVSLSSVGSSP